MKKDKFTHEEILRAIYILDSLEDLMFDRATKLHKAARPRLRESDYRPESIRSFYGACLDFKMVNECGDESQIHLTVKEIAMSDEEFDNYVEEVKRAMEE